MEQWIGKKPTSDQKLLVTLHKKLLQQAQSYIIAADDKVLKVIEANLPKTTQQKVTGILALTRNSIIFVTGHEHWDDSYMNISHIDVREIMKKKEDKEINDQRIVVKSNNSRVMHFDIKKNEDTQEFIEILKFKFENPRQEVLTTVTHDFDYFLHADKLKELQRKNVKTTFILMKRDNLGFSKNGRRLLQERHKGAELIVEGYFKEKKKVNEFIVVDKSIFVYEYDDNERKAKLIIMWPFLFFTNAVVDYFAFKTEITTEEGKLVLNDSGKKFAAILTTAGIPLAFKKRKLYQKTPGFRSGKWWKRTIASLVYAFVLLMILINVFGDEPSKVAADEEINTLSTSESKKDQNDTTAEEKAEADRLAKEKEEKAEADRLAKEKEEKAEAERLAKEKEEKAEAERLAKEKEEKAEADRLVKEKEEKAEAERLAEEQRQEEEAARLAEEKQNANVFYKNCTAVRAAGAAPIHTGDPGYSRKLDRDGDGVACES
ncbi:excalibur calcium-binding domain-containing protein [Planomicrobium sp. CPCC 101079]|uniref:excalibur calcium-binding domain-containing protein n=1 Tax=Planomicrobium sp. CPCC 101079 TaxID=2599618 RepID=UPI0011B66B14|nr:excalibur calcium-binding domain-containing protein [Planomicrobium sp. CPCC 101079]TWT01866.1 excalibur calcium-binding domain-containing protein [Planomicrobium sp. CPCC 101079]